MTYTIKELANLAGVTPRTLRHYHQLGLLLPAYLTEAGYRIYTQVEIDKLQHILFYRELAVPLEQIKDLLTAPTTDS
ncbi:MerR family transcriptional regulator [Vagococcus salmoninarum]